MGENFEFSVGMGRMAMESNTTGGQLRTRRIGRAGINLSFFAALNIAICLAITALGTGCAWTDKSGTHHVVVVGFGMMSVNQSKPEAATVSRSTVIGAQFSAGSGAAFGYLSDFITSVPAGAEDVRIEAKQDPFSPIKIEVQKADIDPAKHQQKDP